MSEHMQVAKTILEQLGGGRFLAFTGARNLVAGRDGLGSLTLRVPSNITKDRVAMVRVTLTPSDTYEVEAFRVRKNVVTPVAKAVDVYCDTLQDTFLELTGLYTRFGQ
jgi:hypothetical protein